MGAEAREWNRGNGELKLLLTFRGIDPLIRDTSEIVVETLLLGYFQVAQHGGPGVEGKAVAFHVPERHKIERHFPAMQVAVNTEVGKRKFTGSSGSEIQPVRYLIYLNEAGQPFDSENSSYIVQYTHLNAVHFNRKSGRKKTYEVRISAIDRLNNESPLSDPVIIKL